jgi:hypothetical protein
MNSLLSRRHALRSSGLMLAAFGVASSGLSLLARPAFAQEVRLTYNDQTAVAVTIYNENLALVKDRRKTEMAKGLNALAFVDVSAQMRPETALLNAEGATLTLLEQNFEFDLLTQEKLLEKSVGQMIKVIKTNPATGAETVEEARVLSVAGGLVLKIGDRIETAYPGRVVFDRIPPELRARPTLVLSLESPDTATREVELSYLTGGLAWKADYVAELTADEKALDLSGWVTLTNTSGTFYRDAKLQLVAGEVNQVQPMMEKEMRTMATDGVAAAPPMAEEALFEYHLYTLSRPTTIADNQTKQVALLSGSGVPVRKELRFVNISQAYNYPIAEQARVNATVRIMFDNKEKDALGMPLPMGIVRVYKNDSAGQAIFVGEDRIAHTPKGETVKLALGQAFDVTAQPKQTEFDQLSDRVFEAAFEIEVKNAKKEAIVARIEENIPGQWEILSESHPHEKVNAFQAAWNVDVPAEGASVLKYKVRVKF